MIRKVSKKKAKAKREQRKMYAAFDESNESFCTGCGRSGLILDHSHILPQGRFPQYANSSFNITFHCRECHALHENPATRHLLKDCESNLAIVRAHDEKAYWEMIGLMELKRK